MTAPIDPNREKDVFISYARSDGKDFAAKLRDRLEPENISCWQDVVGMEGGRDWWQQIQDAINCVKFLVLIMTPAAMTSANVRKEWRYARQQGVCVYPVIATDQFGALVKTLPRWMRDSHFYNLGLDTDHFEAGMNWTKFLNDLRTRCDLPRVPFMPDDLGVFIKRNKEFDALIDLMLDQDRSEPKAITSALALKGAGGYGKTTLARAICHDERIQEAFDDGVLWVTLGESATMDTVRTQLDGLITVLTGEHSAAPTLEAAKTQFRDLLEDRDILLVIDDVWNPDHARPFLQGGERVARLITTRDSETLPDGAQKVSVNAMTGGEAFDLLVYGLPADAIERERSTLAALVASLMEYPLPLKLANGILRERVTAKNQPLDKALSYIRELLEEFGLALNNRQSVVEAALRASLDQLEAQELERFKRLAIFPDDLDIPLDALQMLWDARSAFTENFCDRLEKLSLLLNFDPAAQTIRLHDVIRDFLLRQGGSIVPRHGMVGDFHAGVAVSQVSIPEGVYLEMGGDVIEWQREFLNRYRQPGMIMRLHGGRQPVPTWADLPQTEPYLWDWLAYHLIEAARGDELVTTVLDLRYLAKKTILRGTAKVEADLESAELYAEKNSHKQVEEVKLLTRNYRNMSHLLSRCENVNDVLVTLYTRLSHLDALKPFCEAVEPTLKHPFLTKWHELPDLPHPALVRTLTGHTGRVNNATYSPDGSRIVSASGDHTLKVWDAITGEALLTLTGHTDAVKSTAYNLDGSRIVSASGDHTLKVWDAITGEALLTLSGHKDSVTSVSYNHDGSRIVSASSDKTLKVWDAMTGEIVLNLSGHIFGINSTAHHPDGSRIVSASDDLTLRVWDASTGKVLLTLSGHKDWVTTAAYHPNGSRIVSASDDRTVKVWDAITGKVLLTLSGHESSVTSAAYHPDGSYIVSTSNDRTLKVWDAMTGEMVLTVTGHTNALKSAAYHPNGSRIVSASNDHTLKIWDAAISMEQMSLWNFSKEHTDSSNSVEYNPDGSRIVSASSDRMLKIWDAFTGKVLVILSGHKDRVNSAAYHPDGSQIVSASDDGTLKIWDAFTGETKLTFTGHKSEVRNAAYHPDGSRIVSGSNDHTLKVWDALTGKELLTLTGHTRGVKCAAYSPDGSRIVSASNEGSLKVWDAVTGKTLLTLTGHIFGVSSASYNPDGSRIVSGSYDRTLKIWDAIIGEELLTLSGHTSGVNSATYHPDGSHIVSVSNDRTLKVWSAETGACLAVFYADAPLWSCAWSPDGQQIVAGGEGGYLYWLRWVE